MKSLLILILFFSFPLSNPFLNAQTIIKEKEKSYFKIQGTVRDSVNTEVLPGINILVMELNMGTTTQPDGSYLLKLPQGKYTLVFTSIGYVKRELRIDLNRDLEINVYLNRSTANLNEVVITSQRKFFGNMDYGRDIPRIDTKAISLLNVNNASDILHASVSGVWATKTSGSPGDHEKIRIRGQNSFFSSAEPLYVVDGVPVPIVNLSSLGIADLNINDIESVTVLKDASSTSLYGFQGGNGVVLIDTKKGGENEISYSSRFGFQWFDNFYDLMSSEEQIRSFQQAKAATRINRVIYYPQITDSLCNRDWQREIFRPGYMTENQLSASGTKFRTKYYLSGNYVKHTGNLEGSSYERYTFSSKFTRQFKKRLAVEAGYRGSLQQNNNNQDLYNGNPLLFEGISRSPCLECTPDSLIYPKNFGLPYLRIYREYNGLNSTSLPGDIARNNKVNLDINSSVINASVRYQFTDHFSINAMESFMVRHSIYNYNPSGTLVKSNEDVLLLNQQFNISYFNSFRNNHIDVVAAYRNYVDNLWWELDTTSLAFEVTTPLRNSMVAYGPKGSVLRNLNSYVANTSYNYKEKYFVSVVTNVSKIKEGLNVDYYKVFPSLAFSWDLANEYLIRNISWIDQLNIYVNWGHSGNYPLNGLANDLYQKYSYTNGGITVINPAVKQLANHHLRHENTIETDYGLKTSLFDHRLSFSGVYFSKSIEDLILQRDIPDYYGGGKQFINLGEIRVFGKEFNIEADVIRSRDYYWQVKFNYSTTTNSIVKLDNDKPLKFDKYESSLTPLFVMEKGKELGLIYGYKIIGKMTAKDVSENNKHYTQFLGEKIVNGDTTALNLTPADRVPIGSSIPKYIWNLSSSFRIKNCTLNMQWYAVMGLEKFNATRAATFLTGVNPDINRYIADSLKIIQSPVLYSSSEFIDDAGFIRLQSVTITYEPESEYFGCTKLRFSLSLENMITITKYRGYDPEATTYTDNNFSDNAIDQGAVPNPKGVYFKIGIRF
jgi:TonB-dependent starch-binding outer membrane protein SusC